MWFIENENSSDLVILNYILNTFSNCSESLRQLGVRLADFCTSHRTKEKWFHSNVEIDFLI